MENGKRMVMRVGFVLVLFFVSVSVHAEWKDMGVGEFLGIKAYGHALVTNESWIPRDHDGASSCLHYQWNFYNRDESIALFNILTTILLKDKSLYEVGTFEDKNQINRRQEQPFETIAELYDNGQIQIVILDKKTGRMVYWRYK
jgi:hypothetical protein